MNEKKGIATLPMVIIIGMVTLITVVGITKIAFNELGNSQNSSESSKALFYAESGARDALVKIARNKNYTCSLDDCYLIDFVANGCSNNTECAKVSVSSGLGTSLDPKIIISKGVMRSSVRKVEVRVFLDGGTTNPSLQNGEITNTSWIELTD